METSLGISGLLLGLAIGIFIAVVWNAFLVFLKYDWSTISESIKLKKLEEKLKEENQEKEALINS